MHGFYISENNGQAVFHFILGKTEEKIVYNAQLENYSGVTKNFLLHGPPLR